MKISGKWASPIELHLMCDSVACQSQVANRSCNSLEEDWERWSKQGCNVALKSHVLFLEEGNFLIWYSYPDCVPSHMILGCFSFSWLPGMCLDLDLPATKGKCKWDEEYSSTSQWRRDCRHTRRSRQIFETTRDATQILMTDEIYNENINWLE